MGIGCCAMAEQGRQGVVSDVRVVVAGEGQGLRLHRAQGPTPSAPATPGWPSMGAADLEQWEAECPSCPQVACRALREKNRQAQVSPLHHVRVGEDAEQ
jgi:hypothetical protein